MVTLWLLTGCHRQAAESEPETPPVHTRCIPATRATLAEVRTVRGTVASAPERSAVVSPQVAGRLLRVLVREADPVHAGQVVAEVEGAPLQDALAQARAQLVTAQAGARNAAAALARIEYLFGRGIVARQDADDARMRREQADAAVAQARAAAETAGRNVARTQVRAPLGGVVVRLLKQVGELVDGTSGTPVMEIADPTALEFQGAAPPGDLVVLRPGQRARVSFDALPGRLVDATVRAVSPSITAATGVGAVRLTLDLSGGALPLGLYGAASVAVGERADVVVVPAAAVRNGGATGTEVVVCEGGHAQPREVAVGLRQGDQVQVVHGIEPGTSVAVDNVLAMTAGAAITEAPAGDGGGA